MIHPWRFLSGTNLDKKIWKGGVKKIKFEAELREMSNFTIKPKQSLSEGKHV
jgi:hypothetical protein